MNSGNSIYLQFAGTTQKWCISDTEKLWKSNYANPEKRELLSSLGWTADSISYRFNDQGFRSDDFVGDGCLFLGCSTTAGIGMDWERTWAYKVATALGLKCWNLGIGAGSNDTAFRLADYWIPRLKPKKVFYLAASESRIELLTGNNIIQYMPNMPNKPIEKNEFYFRWLTNSLNYNLNYKKNKLAIQQICSTNSIPISIIDDFDRWDCVASNDFARDLMHAGVYWNESIAERFLSKKAGY